MNTELITTTAGDVLVDIILAVIVLVGAYAVYYIRLAGAQLKVQTKRIEDETARGNNGALLVRQIVNALMADNLIMTPDIGKYLKYLEDGGCIEFTGRSVNAYRKDAVVQLTRKGIDLVEDTIQDGGVNV